MVLGIPPQNYASKEMIHLVHAMLNHKFYRSASDSDDDDETWLPRGWERIPNVFPYTYTNAMGKKTSLYTQTWEWYHEEIRSSILFILRDIRRFMIIHNPESTKIECFDAHTEELPSGVTELKKATKYLKQHRDLKALKLELQKVVGDQSTITSIVEPLEEDQRRPEPSRIKIMDLFVWAGIRGTKFEYERRGGETIIGIIVKDEDDLTVEIEVGDEEEEEEDDRALDHPERMREVAEFDALRRVNDREREEKDMLKRQRLFDNNEIQLDPTRMKEKVSEVMAFNGKCQNPKLNFDEFKENELRDFQAVQIGNFCFTWQDLEQLDLHRNEDDGDVVMNPFTKTPFTADDMLKIWYCYMYNTGKFFIFMPAPEEFIDEMLDKYGTVTVKRRKA